MYTFLEHWDCDSKVRLIVLSKSIDDVVNLYQPTCLQHVSSMSIHWLSGCTIMADIEVDWKKVRDDQTKTCYQFTKTITTGRSRLPGWDWHDNQ